MVVEIHILSFALPLPKMAEIIFFEVQRKAWEQAEKMEVG